LQLLEQTKVLISASQDITPNIRNALECRIRFRAKFLKTIEAADSRTSLDIKTSWIALLDLVPDIKSSTKFGKAVPSSFSVKLQRKLASTVPPRPIVQVGQEAAFDHLERLCRDASVVIEVLKYYDSHSLMVSGFLDTLFHG